MPQEVEKNSERIHQLEDDKIKLVSRGLSGKIEGLEKYLVAKLEEIKNTTIRIETETKKTNGRVTQLEKDKIEHDKQFIMLLQEIRDLRAQHTACPMNNGTYQKEVKVSKTVGVLFQNKYTSAATVIGFAAFVNWLSKVDILGFIERNWMKIIGY